MELENDDGETEKWLDIEFRRILRIIKIFIPCISDVDYLTSYRMWLEKLSEAGRSEKLERNRYLVELCHQIQDGILEAPFTQPPQQGLLPVFRRNVQNISAEQADFLGGFVNVKHMLPLKMKKRRCQANNFAPLIKDKNRQTDAKINIREPITNSEIMKVSNTGNPQNLRQRSGKPHKKRNESIALNDMQKQQCNNFQEMYVQDHPGSPTQIYAQKVSGQNVQPYFNQNSIQQDVQMLANESCLQRPQDNPLYLPLQTQPPVIYYQQQSEAPYVKHQEYSRGMAEELLKTQSRRQSPTSAHQHNFVNGLQQQNFLNVGTDNKNRDDDSSWCDMSEISKTTSRMESGDSTRSSAHDCNASNLHKIHEMCEGKIMELMSTVAELQEQNTNLNAKADRVIQSLAEELTILKSKVQKITEKKIALKNSQLIITSQWHSTVHSLKKKLWLAKNENVQLRDKVAELEKNKEDNATIKQRLCDQYNKEIDMLKQNYVRHIVDIEKKFTRILVDKEAIFNKKINDLQNHYDKKISDFSRGLESC